MSSKITVPELGESIIQATVGRWMKQLGETVAIGDPLVELETEKVTMEIAATSAGILESILKPEGETVGIGEVLGTIGTEGQAAPRRPLPQSATAGSPASQAANATPIARRMATEHGIDGRDLQRISGSGIRGQITQEDVAAYLHQLESPRAETPAARPPAEAPPPRLPSVRTGAKSMCGSRDGDRLSLAGSSRRSGMRRCSPHSTRWI